MSLHRRPTVAVLDFESEGSQTQIAALDAAGANAVLTRDRDVIANADGLGIFGEVTFATLMTQLRTSRTDELVERRIAGGRPVLGVGVGMHVLFDAAVSNGEHIDGLAQWPGVVEDATADREAHSTWMSIDVAEGSTLLAGVEDEGFLFDLPQVVGNWTLEVYGAFNAPAVSYATLTTRVVAAVENGPLSATQFHPEKCGEAGLRVLRNWVQSL